MSIGKTLAALYLAALGMIMPATALRAETEGPLPEGVSFMSLDAKTRLVGYVFEPVRVPGTPVPAVVMMHGRAGAYSESAKTYEAKTLSLRHKAWGYEWAKAGYLAILVDGFGPRGYPHGFPAHSYEDRPEELNEVTIRPLDAYGALAYLRTRPDVVSDRIGLQGWSNGGSATISAISDIAPGIDRPSPQTGFRAALAFYPACGLKGQFESRPFKPYAPTLVFHGTADKEVSPARCRRLIEDSRRAGGDAEIVIYERAEHSFDSPGRKRQRVEANAVATEDAIVRARAFFARHL